MLPSLKLQRTALGAINSGQSTLISANSGDRSVLVAACGDSINLLDDVNNLLYSLPFELAFPIHSALLSNVQAVAFDHTTGRIAAASAGRIAVWHLSSGTWRVHSSFTVPHTTTELHLANGYFVVAGDSLTLWKLDESVALPKWTRVAVDYDCAPIHTARLSPSAVVLASVKQNSSLVRLSSISAAKQSGPVLRHQSYASHSVRIRSLSWRDTDSPNDSGPVLYTQTLDGIFRIWGCEIDEPDFFSLWATLDIYTNVSSNPPLSTLFLRRRRTESDSEEHEDGSRNNSEDFVTYFADGSAHMTTVSNFDRRPPTCLKQVSSRLQKGAFRRDQLANLRHVVLLASAQQLPIFVGRDSRGTLVRHEIQNSEEPELKTSCQPATTITVSQLGTIRRLLSSGAGNAMLALGSNGRIQNWEVGDDGLPYDTYVSDPSIKPSTKVASWHDGRMVVTAGPAGVRVYSFRSEARLQLIAELGDALPPLSKLFVTRASEDTPSTTITALTSDFITFNWTFSSATKTLVLGSQQSLNESRSPDVPLVWANAVPPSAHKIMIEEMAICAVDAAGRLTFWIASIPSSAYMWKEAVSIETGREEVKMASSSAERISALISVNEGAIELSIWDSRTSEFASGQQHAQVLDTRPVDITWSAESSILAVAFVDHVELYCAQRLDDLSDQPSWAAFANLKLSFWETEPLSSVCWLSSGIAVSSAENVFFFSSRLDSGQAIHALAQERIAPLPQHHPQLLYQALLQGHTELVTRILETIAAQLTDAGDVTPIRNSRADDQITVEDFIEAQRCRSSRVNALHTDNDLYTSLKNTLRQEDSTPFGEAQVHRLLLALKQRPLRGLSTLEHDHLAVIVQAVFEVQHQRSALDSNGLRYLISMHTFRIYHTPNEDRNSLSSASRLKYRDVVWAFHSESQELLLQESTKACQAQVMTWSDAKALGVFLWLRSIETIRRHIEIIGRAEFIRPGLDDRDPISATVFYLALRKKHIVVTFWKQAGGHLDQRTMLKFLANDFTEQRWKSAALKNAFALMSKRRFLFAVAFFLLGDSLKDAVNVCLRQLGDFQMAVAITRAYEGDSSPVLKSILEEHVLPLAFGNGFRWLASWAFWMLDRRDLAIQTVVTPLATLANHLPYKLDSIGSITHEDPSLILLFSQLRSKSLQTMKGAVAISGSVEFNFVLHMARVLCRMGCHVLALSLVSNYEFSQPEQLRALDKPTTIHPRRRIGLRRMSTVMDMEVPSAINSRAPSPSPGSRPPQPTSNGFNQMLKKVKVETKAPAEFSFDAFDF